MFYAAITTEASRVFHHKPLVLGFATCAMRDVFVASQSAEKDIRSIKASELSSCGAEIGYVDYFDEVGDFWTQTAWPGEFVGAEWRAGIDPLTGIYRQDNQEVVRAA